MCFLAQVPHWPKYCLGQQFVLETGWNLRWQQVNQRKKRKGEVLKNDWLKLPVIEEYCIYGAWLNKYINLPACFHKDQKLRGLVGMIPFHRSKPGIVLGEKIWHFLKDDLSYLFQFSPLSFSAMLSSMVLELNFRSCRSNTRDWGTGLLQITLLARECLNTSLCYYLIQALKRKHFHNAYFHCLRRRGQLNIAARNSV